MRGVWQPLRGMSWLLHTPLRLRLREPGCTLLWEPCYSLSIPEGIIISTVIRALSALWEGKRWLTTAIGEHPAKHLTHCTPSYSWIIWKHPNCQPSITYYFNWLPFRKHLPTWEFASHFQAAKSSQILPSVFHFPYPFSVFRFCIYIYFHNLSQSSPQSGLEFAARKHGMHICIAMLTTFTRDCLWSLTHETGGFSMWLLFFGVFWFGLVFFFLVLYLFWVVLYFVGNFFNHNVVITNPGRRFTICITVSEAALFYTFKHIQKTCSSLPARIFLLHHSQHVPFSSLPPPSCSFVLVALPQDSAILQTAPFGGQHLLDYIEIPPENTSAQLLVRN